MKNLAALISVICVAACTTASPYGPEMEKGIERTKLDVAKCVEKREVGAFKTYEQTAICGNKAIQKHITPHSAYPMLVNEYTQYRLEIAKQTDDGNISYEYGQNLIDQKGKSLTEQAVKLADNEAMKEWASKAKERGAFNMSRCQFDVYGTRRCAAW